MNEEMKDLVEELQEIVHKGQKALQKVNQKMGTPVIQLWRVNNGMPGVGGYGSEWVDASSRGGAVAMNQPGHDHYPTHKFRHVGTRTCKEWVFEGKRDRPPFKFILKPYTRNKLFIGDSQDNTVQSSLKVKPSSHISREQRST